MRHTLNQTKVTLWVSPDTVQVNVTSVPDLACISGSSISELDDFNIVYNYNIERHKTLNASPILNKKVPPTVNVQFDIQSFDIRSWSIVRSDRANVGGIRGNFR